MSVSNSFAYKIKECRKQALKILHNEEIKVLEENLRTPLENIDDYLNKRIISKSNDNSILCEPIIARGKFKKQNSSANIITKNPSKNLITNNNNDDNKKLSIKRQLSTQSLHNDTKNINLEVEIEDKKVLLNKPSEKKTLAEKTNETILKKKVIEMLGKNDSYLMSQKEMKEKPNKNNNTERLIRNNDPLYVRYYQELAKKEFKIENMRQKILEEKANKLNYYISNSSLKNRSYREHEINLNKTQIIENFQMRNELWIRRKEENLQIMNEIKQNFDAMNKFPFKPKLNTSTFSKDNEPFLEKLQRTSSERLINKKKLLKKHTPSFKPKLNNNYSYISCHSSFNSLETRKSTGFKSTFNKSLKLSKNAISNLTKKSKGALDFSLNKKKENKNKIDTNIPNSSINNKTNDSNDLYKINYKNDLSYSKQPKANNIILEKKHKDVYNILKKNKFVQYDKSSSNTSKRNSFKNNSLSQK